MYHCCFLILRLPPRGWNHGDFEPWSLHRCLAFQSSPISWSIFSTFFVFSHILALFLAPDGKRLEKVICTYRSRLPSTRLSCRHILLLSSTVDVVDQASRLRRASWKHTPSSVLSKVQRNHPTRSLPSGADTRPAYEPRSGCSDRRAAGILTNSSLGRQAA